MISGVMIILFLVVMGNLVLHSVFVHLDNREKPAFPVINGTTILFESGTNWTDADIVMMETTTGEQKTVIKRDGNQYRPDISGEIIVWQDKNNGKWSIFALNQTSGVIFPVSVSGSRNTAPRISGDRVVFVDETSGNPDIRMVNISTGRESMICAAPDVQWQPAIDGDWIVWEDWRDGAASRGDIIGYHVPSGREMKISDSLPGRADWFPDISSGWVVWQSDQQGNFDIFAKNLTTDESVQVTTDPARQWLPKISGTDIVWMDERNGMWDIYGFNLTTRQERAVTCSTDQDAWPDISGGIVVYVQYCKHERIEIKTVDLTLMNTTGMNN